MDYKETAEILGTDNEKGRLEKYNTHEIYRWQAKRMKSASNQLDKFVQMNERISIKMTG